MNNFDTLLKKILNNPKKGMIITIKNVPRKLVAMVYLTTINYMKDDSDYIKMLFEDGSFLLVIPSEKEIYYADKVIGHVKEIDGEDIGKKEIIEFKGKEYKLDNKDDYQFVLKLMVGLPTEIEGECKFSDYVPVSGGKELLSLGWLTRTGERADIWCKLINRKDVEVE